MKLCSPLLLRFLATPLRHPMNNKYHFRNISLVIWVQNSGKTVDKNISPSKNFLLCTLPTSARCQDLFFFRESNFGTEGAHIISLPRGPDFLSTALFIMQISLTASQRLCTTAQHSDISLLNRES